MPSYICDNCQAQIYDPHTSTSEADGLYSLSSVTYGNATLFGSVYEDTVCLATDNPVSCATELNLFSFFSQTGLGTLYDGILGLAPPGLPQTSFFE